MLKGYRTYLVLAVAMILGVIDTWNEVCLASDGLVWCKQINVPGWVFSILASFGIYTRSIANSGK